MQERLARGDNLNSQYLYVLSNGLRSSNETQTVRHSHAQNTKTDRWAGKVLPCASSEHAKPRQDCIHSPLATIVGVQLYNRKVTLQTNS